MKNIFMFFTCLFMCNAVLGNCTNSEELKDVIFQNAHRIVKSNGKYIGFFLEENAKIIDFNLVKLCDKQTEVSVYALDSYIQLNVKNEDEKLKGFIEVGCLDDNIFQSTINLEIKENFQILSSKKTSQIRKNGIQTRNFTLFYINISDFENTHSIEIPKKSTKYKLLN